MKKIFTFFGFISMIAFSNAQIVINEVYTGGGLLTGALFASDFIELKNIGSTTSSLSGATIQYGPSSGAFTQYHTLPSISLAPGQTYLIQQATGLLGGLSLINPNLIVNLVLNFDGSGPLLGVGINLNLTAGKVALASNSVQVTGPTAANVIDFVGYGGSTQYEGAGAAPEPNIFQSINRVSGDTNNNNIDFTLGTPTPQSTGTVLATSDTSATSFNLVKNTRVTNGILMFAEGAENIKIYSASGQLMKSPSGKMTGIFNVAFLPKGKYVISGTLKGRAMSQAILVH